MESLPAAQQALGALPSTLDALVQQAEQVAAQLEQQHGLEPLAGLPALLGLPDASATSTSTSPREEGSTVAEGCRWMPRKPSLAQSVGLPALSNAALAGAAGDGYAASVVADFRAKLWGSPQPAAGTQPAEGAAQLAQQQAPATLDVEEAVQRLVAEASSEANLARMYEGWMAWV